jgi:hypothetical protein
MSSRAGLSVDIIQTKLLYFRNYTDNAPISSHNILYADGSGGTYWSSLYIQNIPGFSSFYSSTLGLASSISYDATYGLSTFYASTVNAYGNSLSTFSTNFNVAFIPGGVYSTIAGLGTLGYVSSQTLGRSLQSTLAGISPFFVSSVSTTQYKRLAVNIAPDAFEFVSSTKRVASFAYNGSLSIGPFAPATQLDVSGSALFRSPNGVYVYPGNISVGKNLGATINAELDISGSIIANNIYIQNRGIFNGPVTASAYLTSSDSNLKTNINNYGVINVLQSKEIKERIKKTCLNKFGVEHASQSEQVRKKMKETCLTKYGVENALQSKETKEQIKKTCLEKYGVEYPLQNSEVAEKSSKNAYSKKIYTFPSGRQEFIQGYENLALDELLQKEKIEENDIITSRKLVPKIWYNDENSKKHRHYVDIFIPSQNKCIEVKSNWTAEKKKDCIYLKQQAAKELGYEYEIWIYNGKFNKVKTIL